MAVQSVLYKHHTPDLGAVRSITVGEALCFVQTFQVFGGPGGGDTQCAGGPLGRRCSPLLLSFYATGVTGTSGAVLI